MKNSEKALRFVCRTSGNPCHILAPFVFSFSILLSRHNLSDAFMSYGAYVPKIIEIEIERILVGNSEEIEHS